MFPSTPTEPAPEPRFSQPALLLMPRVEASDKRKLNSQEDVNICGKKQLVVGWNSDRIFHSFPPSSTVFHKILQVICWFAIMVVNQNEL